MNEPKPDPDITGIAKLLDPWGCQVAMATIATILGSVEKWEEDGITTDTVASVVDDLLKDAKLPKCSVPNEAAIDFWTARVDW